MFEGLTVIVMAMNERSSLEQTVDTVIDVCDKDDIYEIIIVLPSENCPSAQTGRSLASSDRGVPIRTYIQTDRNRSVALNDSFSEIKSSHFVYIGADLEMDPVSLRDMIAVSKEKPDSIVCASKWHKESKVYGLDPLHALGSWTVNRAAAFILGSKGTDLFVLYEIYPKSVLDRMRFSAPENVLYEYTLRPVSEGVEYIEIPTVFRKRTDGRSTVSLKQNLEFTSGFIKAALRLRRETLGKR